ncbi:MAG: hypothetical protein R2827_03145 [Bdellovibrionales bacterium]
MTNEKNLIPAGRYIGRIIEYAITKREGQTSPELQVQFEFDVPGLGKRKLTSYKYFTDKGRKYALQALAILGLKGNDPSVLVENHFGSGYLDEEGEFEIEVIQESYQGETKNKIGWVNRPGAGGVAKVEGNAAQSLKGQLGDLRGSMVQARKDTNTDDPSDNDPIL